MRSKIISPLRKSPKSSKRSKLRNLREGRGLEEKEEVDLLLLNKGDPEILPENKQDKDNECSQDSSTLKVKFLSLFQIK